jgi:O-antigen/teichoic acid export membrane protein
VELGVEATIVPVIAAAEGAILSTDCGDSRKRVPERSSPSRDAPEPMLGGYARGVAWTYLSVVLSGAATLFLAGWSVRRVGTGQFGVFVLVTAITGVSGIFDYALGLAVQRASARVDAESDPRNEQLGIVHAAHGAYTIFGTALAGIGLLAAGFIRIAGPVDTPHLAAVVGLLGLVTGLEVGTAALPAVAMGCRHFSLRAAAMIAGLAVRVPFGVLTIDRYGIAGLAFALLLGVVMERLVLVSLLPRGVSWFVIRPSTPQRAALRRATGFAFPLLVLNISGLLFELSDLVVVGALVGASSVGVFQIGALLPLQVAGVLMLGYNVAFPALSGSNDHAMQEVAVAFLTRVFSFVAGTALALAAFLRADIVTILLGRRSALAEEVLIIFCGAWMANLIVHGLALLLIARGDQVLMARVVAAELPLNIVLTVSFVTAFGAVGAALATIVTVILMNFVALPIVARDRFSRPTLVIVSRDGFCPAALGVALAVLAAGVATLTDRGAARLAVGVIAAAGLAGSTGLVLAGSSGRTMLREMISKDAAMPGSAPAVGP